jgi:hypothetical protein
MFSRRCIVFQPCFVHFFATFIDETCRVPCCMWTIFVLAQMERLNTVATGPQCTEYETAIVSSAARCTRVLADAVKNQLAILLSLILTARGRLCCFVLQQGTAKGESWAKHVFSTCMIPLFPWFLDSVILLRTFFFLVAPQPNFGSWPPPWNFPFNFNY